MSSSVRIRTVQSMNRLGLSTTAPPPLRRRVSSPSSMTATKDNKSAIISNSRNDQRQPSRVGISRRPPAPARKAKNIHREYQIYQRQTFLLIGTASLSFLLFLLFTLPIAALVGLTVMVTSLGACLLVASAAVKTKYQLELQHPLGLIRHLPESLRAHLTEKSLHDCLLSPSASKESLPSLSREKHSSQESLSSLTQHSSSKGN
mmetsp:Transcript_15556/g.29518  ORF Transcript_15556/g.29518 Transcript_15556/m.29518 type:complete len:204 (+) Transcript_15556:313-924(+)